MIFQAHEVNKYPKKRYMNEIQMGEEQSGNIEFDKPISERFKKKNYQNK